jgi:hypothetical protein
MLFVIEFQVSLAITVDQRPSGDHFRVEAGSLRYQTPKIATVSIAPVHTRRCTETPWAVYIWLARILHWVIVA